MDTFVVVVVVVVVVGGGGGGGVVLQQREFLETQAADSTFHFDPALCCTGLVRKLICLFVTGSHFHF